MKLSLLEASKLAGITKSALFKAMKRGVVSAEKDVVSGEWRIDTAELGRVYSLVPPAEEDHSLTDKKSTSGTNDTIESLVKMVKMLENERDWLRGQVDSLATERKSLTALLTHQPSRVSGPRHEFVYALILAVFAAIGWLLVQ